MNRGLEIADAVAGPPNCLVLRQVAAGVTVRMAVRLSSGHAWRLQC